MHLPRDGSGLSRSGVLKGNYFDQIASGRLRDGHAGRPCGRIGSDFHAAPLMRVETVSDETHKCGATVIVLAGAIVPVPSIRRLELDPTQRIERPLVALRAGAEDQDAGLMVG